MFGIGMPEAILIGIVALLVVGPKKLPELAKTLGKGFSEFRRTANDVTDGFKETIKADEMKDELKKDVASVKTAFLYDRDDDAASDLAAVNPPAAENAPPSTPQGNVPKA
jgi:Tat protein translocase TatB subunit